MAGMTEETQSQPASAPSSVLAKAKSEEIYKDLLHASDISEEKRRADTRRTLRVPKPDVKSERAQGNIGPKDTIISVPFIDRGVSTDVPTLTGGLNKAKFLISLISHDNPLDPVHDLSLLFTKLARDTDWLVPWVRLADCVSLHGGGYMEIVPDLQAPAGFRLEFIHRHSLVVASKASSLDEQRCVARRFSLPYHQVLHMFNSGVLDSSKKKEIIPDEEDHDPNQRIDLDKVFMKDEEGSIWVGFRSPNYTEDWLTKGGPQRLSSYYEVLSRDQPAVDSAVPFPDNISWEPPYGFPIVYLPYMITEREEMLKAVGRAYYDAPTQEVVSNLWTGIANQAIKASDVYGSPAGLDNNLGETQPLMPNQIAPQPLNFWSPPAPDPNLIKIAVVLEQQHQRGSGRPDVAAMSKTGYNVSAREIGTAVDLANQMSFTKTLPFAITVRRVYELGWQMFQYKVYASIVRSNPPEYLTPELAKSILRPYTVQTGGVSDVLEMQETAQKILNILPQFAQHPMVTDVLMRRLLMVMLPSLSDEVQEAFTAQQDLLNIATQVTKALSAVPPSENINHEQLNQFVSAVWQKLAPYGVEEPPGIRQAAQPPQEAGGGKPSQGGDSGQDQS